MNNYIYIKCPKCNNITELNMNAVVPRKKYVYTTESICRVCKKVVTIKFEVSTQGIRLIFVGDEE